MNVRVNASPVKELFVHVLRARHYNCINFSVCRNVLFLTIPSIRSVSRAKLHARHASMLPNALRARMDTTSYLIQTNVQHSAMSCTTKMIVLMNVPSVSHHVCLAILVLRAVLVMQDTIYTGSSVF